MDKKEFLEDLRQALVGEVNPKVLEDNIRYYDQYIGSRSSEEEERILQELGNPRLIAKTIIEAEKATGEKKHFTGSQGSYDYHAKMDDEFNKQENDNLNQTRIYTNLTLWQKILVAFIIIVFLLVLFFVGRIIIGFLIAFAVPIILVLLVFTLFKKRN
jgi:uncharacterized membrane protein